MSTFMDIKECNTNTDLMVIPTISPSPSVRLTPESRTLIDLSERFIGVANTSLSSFEHRRISLLVSTGLNSAISQIINAYCKNKFFDDFHDIPKEIPYDPASYPGCSLVARFICCFRIPQFFCCPDFTRRKIDRLNTALMNEDLALATECYRSGIRWNAYPFHEHFRADFDCTDSSDNLIDLSRPFRVVDGCQLIRELATKNKQIALFWIIKQASQLSYNDSWEIASRSSSRSELHLNVEREKPTDSGLFWINRQCDPFAHAYVASLIKSLYDSSSTITERCTLLRAFIMRYPLNAFPKTAIQLETVMPSISALKLYTTGIYKYDETPTCANSPGCAFVLTNHFQFLQCKNFLLHLVVEHFKRALKGSEIEILDCILENKDSGLSIRDFVDHNEPGSPHFIYSHRAYLTPQLAAFWEKQGLKVDISYS